MRKIIATCIATALACLALPAQESSGIKLSGAEFSFDEGVLVLRATLDLSTVVPSSTKAYVITPVVYSDSLQAEFPSVGIYGARRFWSIAREKRSDNPLGVSDFLYEEIEKSYPYEGRIHYEEWMDKCAVRLDMVESSCCGQASKATQGNAVEGFEVPDYTPDPLPEMEPDKVEVPTFKPVYLYVLPPAEPPVKSRDISGEAYVVFASGKTDVDPDYRDNLAELAKISATIDSVRTDPDMSITRITLKGYSSPDGSYATNNRLAEARTEAIKTYVSGLDSLSSDIYAAEWEAENWEGLRAAVEASSLQGKEGIRGIIDSEAAPDTKEARLKKNYPKAWQHMVTEIFPTLRRTDYRVSYTVRSYTTREEILEIMRTRPQNLSVGEFFIAADGYDRGSLEFNHVFAIAARIYPFEDAVNINAANAAMKAGNLGKAAFYLDSVNPENPEGTYARGILDALNGNWLDAEDRFRAASEAGIAEAGPALESAQEIAEALASLQEQE